MKRVTNDERRTTSEEPSRAPALFRRSVWNGQINYECGQCPYATLDALVMANHLRVVHGIQTGNTATGARTPAEPIVLIQADEVIER